MYKKIINKILRWKGYEISRIQTLDIKIKSGKFNWIKQLNIKTVLDVGANTGQFAHMINKILPGVKIYSFEPIKECFEILKQLENANSNLKTFNFALGNKSGEQTIFKNEFLPSSSLLNMAELHKNIFPYAKESEPETIFIKTLDSISDQIVFQTKVLLKVDVQGFEINVLKGAISSLSNIDVIIIETLFVELYYNQTQFDDIYSFLVNRNFSYRGNFEQINDPKSGRILWADAIFIKN